jgi:hypothetical protein
MTAELIGPASRRLGGERAEYGREGIAASRNEKFAVHEIPPPPKTARHMVSPGSTSWTGELLHLNLRKRWFGFRTLRRRTGTPPATRNENAPPSPLSLLLNVTHVNRIDHKLKRVWPVNFFALPMNLPAPSAARVFHSALTVVGRCQRVASRCSK